MTSYSKFAEYYDILTENIDYKKHAEYYNSLVSDFNGQKGILLDLACGTGSLSEEMARLGYDVIGVDLSQEMLSMAMDKKYDSGLPIQYLFQDMCELDMYGTLDIVICALDSLNHLPDIKSLKRAVERVSLFSNPDGLFIFDLNTEYKHREILSDNVFIYDTEKVYCVWENSYNADDNSVDIDLTFFEKDSNGYQRYEESFSENAYPIEAIDEILIESGFEIVAHYDYLTKQQPTATSEKITFIARKVN